MIFNNYCAIFIINTEGVEKEVKRISEGHPRTIVAQGLTIVTFVSPLEGRDIDEYFKSLGRNFMYFDVNEPGSGYHFDRSEFMVEVFGDMFKTNEMDLDKLTSKFMQSVNNQPKYQDATDAIMVEDEDEEEMDIFEYIETLNKTERNEMMNNIIDKGKHSDFKYTALDETILSKLANS